MTINWKNVLERMAWTFIEGFLGAMTFSVETDKSMLFGAFIAGISAVKTVIIEIARQQLQ